MTVEVEAYDIEGNKIRVELNRFPDRCPMCHHYIEAKAIGTALRGNSRVEVAFRCPRRDCRRMFVGTFRQPIDRSAFELTTTGPSVPLEPVQPDTIKEVSPSFVKIYKQAAHAESIDLMEVAGIGYRKALEFLIKDFAIKRQPDKEQEIKGAYLGTVINNYIDDSQVKARAKRATWLGNDESHYVPEWGRAALRRSAQTSSAVEGIHAPFAKTKGVEPPKNVKAFIAYWKRRAAASGR